MPKPMCWGEKVLLIQILIMSVCVGLGYWLAKRFSFWLFIFTLGMVFCFAWGNKVAFLTVMEINERLKK